MVAIRDSLFTNCSVHYAVEEYVEVELKMVANWGADYGWAGAYLYVYAESGSTLIYNETLEGVIRCVQEENTQAIDGPGAESTRVRGDRDRSHVDNGRGRAEPNGDLGPERWICWVGRHAVEDRHPTDRHRLLNGSAYDTCSQPGGGALFLAGGGNVTVAGCYFNGLDAFSGAGGVITVTSSSVIASDQTSLNVRDCHMMNGLAEYYGSAIYNLQSYVKVINSYIDEPTMTSQTGTFFSSGGSFDCTSSCDFGYYGDCEQTDDILECHSCKIDACIACPRGKWGAKVGGVSEADACSTNSAGTYTNTTGSTEEITCPAGSYATDSPNDVDGIGVQSGATECVACPAGKLSSAPLATSCEDCPVGKSTNNTDNATACDDCLPGYFAEDDGQASCDACAVGRY